MSINEMFGFMDNEKTDNSTKYKFFLILIILVVFNYSSASCCCNYGKQEKHRKCHKDKVKNDCEDYGNVIKSIIIGFVLIFLIKTCYICQEEEEC